METKQNFKINTMNKNLKISIRIIALFTLAIFISFIPELSPNFFGDWYCVGRTVKEYNIIGYPEYMGCDMFPGNGDHNPTWHFGYRHYLFFLMGISLSIIQIAKIVNIVMEEK